MENTMKTQDQHKGLVANESGSTTSLGDVFRSFFPPFNKLKRAEWIPASITGLTIKSVAFQLLVLYVISITADYAGKVAFV